MNVDAPSPNNDLLSKVEGWLDKEGYPLEFRTANQFQRQGFTVRQGLFVRCGKDDSAREIDVAAYVDTLDDENRRPFLRAYYIAECKWSRDKPWVVFSSPGGISDAACIYQTFGSDLGRATLWALAGDPRLHRLRAFETPRRPGFGGRQALAKDNVDSFYNSMKSITTLARELSASYDERRVAGRMPEVGVVVFPIIVVDGRLFEAWFDVTASKMKVEERPRMRLHWKGAPSWSHHATVDIVTADHLTEFVAGRYEELTCLLAAMTCTADQIAECFGTASLDPLTVTPGARGVLGLPKLLREIRPQQVTTG